VFLFLQNKIGNFRLAQFALIITTLIWGSTFIIVKDALSQSPPFYFGFFRFFIGAIVMIFLLDRSTIFKKNELYPAIICGLFLFSGYSFQNFGLVDTTPTLSAFITSVSVLMVPVILAIFQIEKIKIKIWIAVFVACFGIHLLTPNGLIDLGIGDQLTFGCALSFAIHIIFQGRYMKKIKSINNFFFIQSMVVAILSLFSGFLFEDFSAIQFDFSLLMAFLITGILATTVALLMMIWAQTVLSAPQTAIIIILEPVFAALFSVGFAYEILSPIQYVGCMVVLIAVFIGEK
tara:strand:+ start:3539 stop:4408 length:870 start_codon:yes stop_codon:yes gene_type:complete